jgi:hypothetical protein
VSDANAKCVDLNISCYSQGVRQRVHQAWSNEPTFLLSTSALPDDEVFGRSRCVLVSSALAVHRWPYTRLGTPTLASFLRGPAP